MGKATPEIKDPNGATVRSQTVPAGYSAKEGDWYTYSIVDLTALTNVIIQTHLVRIRDLMILQRYS